jgi:hypothetical protein
MTVDVSVSDVSWEDARDMADVLERKVKHGHKE